jgi:hypothetical protein
MRFALVAVGRIGALVREVGVAPVSNRNAVVYHRHDVIERWDNGPLGLEQTFTVASRLPGSGSLELAIGCAGAGVRATRARGSVVFDGRSATLRYAGLVASDAHGRILPARLLLRDRRIVISVDDRGAAYPLRIDPFLQHAELTASDGTAPDGLGLSVGIDGSTIVAGAPDHTTTSTGGAQGAVYVFTRPWTGWANATQTAELTAADGASGDRLGHAVAISGRTIVATSAAHGGHGAVYVFTEPSGGWRNATQTAELTASDGTLGGDLGWSVAASGSTIVAGDTMQQVGSHIGQGAAYVFTKPPGGWTNATQTAELTASDGAAFDALGYAVAASGSTVIVSTPVHDSDSGAVYVYTEPSSGWADATQTAELSAAGGAVELGASVAVAGSTIAAGAPLTPVDGIAQGAVFVWSEPGSGWADAAQPAELTAPAGVPNDLGFSVAASGADIVAGAIDPGSRQGAVYVFAAPTTGWTNERPAAELAASEAVPNDQLGWSVEASGATIVAGAPQHPYVPTGDAGAVYDYVLPSAPADLLRPLIVGTAAPGRSVLATRGIWSKATGLTYSYQWELCAGSSGQGCTTLADATSRLSPALASTEAGSYITVLVTATSASGASGHAVASRLVS